MLTAADFSFTPTALRVKKDQYPLAKINDARLKTNRLGDHVLRVTLIALLVSSVVWTICPDSFGLVTVPFALLVGALFGLASVRKYELQIEFRHSDETGLQWLSIAKTSNATVKTLFEQQISLIRQHSGPDHSPEA